MNPDHPVTTDGRYFIDKGRLWRRSNPALDDDTRDRLVKELMSARRAVREAKGNPHAVAQARKLVDDAKVSLGERGPVWWGDGAPDLNRHLAKNTSYADWFAKLQRMPASQYAIVASPEPSEETSRP